MKKIGLKALVWGFVLILIVAAVYSLIAYRNQYEASEVLTQVSVKAFPTCEGFGCIETTGGRGGETLRVTNLSDYNTAVGESPVAGSLRYLLSQQGTSPKTVVFRTGGVIELKTNLPIPSNTTIAGQTAPGDGIAIKGTLSIDSNTILRYLRVRPGEISSSDGIEIVGSNNIIDHCSISWANDEGIGFKRNQDLDTTDPPLDRNVTIQWSIFAEEEKGILAWFGHKTTIHHNLFAHHDYRNPNVAGGSIYPHFHDVANNVVYDVSEAASQAPGAVNLNYRGNYTKSPRDSRDHVYSLVIDDANPLTKIFAEGNVGPHTLLGEPSWNEIRSELGGPADEAIHRVGSAWATPAVSIQSAEQAYESVLGSAGANKPSRDPVDERIVDVVRTGTYSSVVRGPADARALAANYWPTLVYAAGTAPDDQDGDGIADDWEAQQGMNPDDYNDSKLDRNNDGYTNLEDYLNALASGYVPPAAQNGRPSLSDPGTRTGRAGEELSFILSASDPDGDGISFSAANLPAGASLNPNSGQFTWTPEAAGDYIITFTASDGVLFDTIDVSFFITADNDGEEEGGQEAENYEEVDQPGIASSEEAVAQPQVTTVKRDKSRTTYEVINPPDDDLSDPVISLESKSLADYGVISFSLAYNDVPIPGINLANIKEIEFLKEKALDPFVIVGSESPLKRVRLTLIDPKGKTLSTLYLDKIQQNDAEAIFLSEDSIVLSGRGKLSLVYEFLFETESRRVSKSLIITPGGTVYVPDFREEEKTASKATISLLRKDVEGDGYTLYTSLQLNQSNPALSDENGNYHFFAPPGEYKIIAEKIGYKKTEINTTVSKSYIAGENIKLEINPLIYYLVTISAVAALTVIVYFAIRKIRRKRQVFRTPIVPTGRL